ncbi:MULTISPECIES: hypothetical protein [Subtercola]|uniref:hypothetical protein n=1 Tax=Subtercola TaxID=120212 RepID=UPI00137607AE|nr:MULTISPECIES: hypothetical protein [Subtercola]MEA9986204.1 hypothetical protein [Subtercola sp. RTI3]
MPYISAGWDSSTTEAHTASRQLSIAMPVAQLEASPLRVPVFTPGLWRSSGTAIVTPLSTLRL